MSDFHWTGPMSNCFKYGDTVYQILGPPTYTKGGWTCQMHPDDEQLKKEQSRLDQYDEYDQQEEDVRGQA